ncbi:MAG TPA: DUF4198 domain-containing protein [Acidobacteriota bacterium]|nr:DUF4198 domain-containing protein [Acidobacteriota bacterium]
MIKKITLITIFAFQSFLFAHDLYLRGNPFRMDTPGKLKVSMNLAEAFPGREEPWRADKTSSFTINGPSGIRKIEDKPKLSPTVDLSEEGTYVVGWSATPSYINIDAAHFNEYLDAEGHTNVIKIRKERNQEDKGGTEKYSRYLKTMIQVGSKLTDQYKVPLGFKIEIVPQTNPYSLKVGESLDVEVLLDGKPLPDNAVMATYDTHSKEHDVYAQLIRTDEKGKAKINFTNSGVWMIRSNHMAELQNDPKAEWESHWANLSFQVR